MPTSRSPRPLLLAAAALAAAALVTAVAVPAEADPISLTVAAAAPVVTLPIGDGYRDVESLVVTASSATTASVTVQRAGGTPVVVGQDLPLATGANPIAVPTAGLVAGAYTATVATADGASATAGFSVQALRATLTTLSVQRSLSTVFPVRDGYRDTVVFTVTPTIDGPATAKVTGTARLSRGSRTVRTWKLHAGTNRLVWNGRVRGTVEPGGYTLSVRAKGPQGGARTAHSSVAVSAKRLVTRTATVTKLASSVLSRFQSYDAAKQGTCAYSGPLVGCVGSVAADGATFSVIVGGTVAVPSAVRRGTAYAKPQLRVAIHTTRLTGGAVWGAAAGSAHVTGTLGKGTTVGTLGWSGDPATASVFIGLDSSSSFVADRFVFTYRYRTLV